MKNLLVVLALALFACSSNSESQTADTESLSESMLVGKYSVSVKMNSDDQFARMAEQMVNNVKPTFDIRDDGTILYEGKAFGGEISNEFTYEVKEDSLIVDKMGKIERYKVEEISVGWALHDTSGVTTLTKL